MNPIAKRALKRALSARLTLPTSVLDEPEAVQSGVVARPVGALEEQVPAPIPAAVAAPEPEENPMQPVTQIKAQVNPGTGGRPGYNSRNADKFVIRLTDGLRDRVQVYARSQFCSMNSFMLKAVIKEVERLDSLEGKESPAVEVSVVEPTGNESMEALVLRIERAVASMERLQSTGRLQ